MKTILIKLPDPTFEALERLADKRRMTPEQWCIRKLQDIIDYLGDDYLRAKEAAHKLGITLWTFNSLKKRGMFRSIIQINPRVLRYLRSEVDRIIESRKLYIE